MKTIKFTIVIGVLLCALFIISIGLVRKPSYEIQTEGKLYIVNKLSKSITVFDLFEGRELSEFPMDIEPHELTTLHNQKSIVVTDYGRPEVEGKSISVIDVETNEVIKRINLNGSLKPHGIITFPETDKVGVVTDIGNELLIVDVETGVVEKQIPTRQKFSHLIAQHPNKPLLYVTNIHSNSVSVIDIELNEVVQVIPCGLGTEGIDITPDGTEVWVSNKKENSINIIDTKTNQITDTLTAGKEPLRLKFSVDGKYCIVPNASDGTISVFSRKNKNQIKSIDIPGNKNLIDRVLYHTPRPVGILMHPNGLFAFVANSNADKVEVIDMNTFTIVSTIGTGRVPDGLTLVQN